MVYKNELIVVPRDAQKLVRVILYDLIHKLLRLIAQISYLNPDLALRITYLQKMQASKRAYRELVWQSRRLNTEDMAYHLYLHRADDLNVLASRT